MKLEEVEPYRKKFNALSFQIIKLLSAIWLDIHHYRSITIPTNTTFTNVLQQIRDCLDKMESEVNKSTVTLPVDEKPDMSKYPPLWE